MDEYFKIKTFFEFKLPLIAIGAVIVAFIILLIRAFIADYMYSKKVKILIDAGYERYLLDVASCGNGETWGYILKSKDDDHWRDQLKDSEIYKMSMRQIKDRVKSFSN